MLVCRDVDVEYDGVQVLFGVDFDVEEGEIIALLGTNGAGKSTLSNTCLCPLLAQHVFDLVGEEVARESMATLRDDLADIAARLQDAERRAADLPHREKYLRLVTGFSPLPRAAEELLDDVERELASQRTPRSPQPA